MQKIWSGLIGLNDFWNMIQWFLLNICTYNKLVSLINCSQILFQFSHMYRLDIVFMLWSVRTEWHVLSQHDDIHRWKLMIHPVLAMKINELMMLTNYSGLLISLKDATLPFSPDLASYSWCCTWLTFKRFYFLQIDRFSWCKAISYVANRCISEWLCLLCRFVNFQLVYRRMEQ